ncbi:MAG: hypothetical protein HQL20_05560 [Candidatus Omnitrophica bacterium]|nr:hypothetical protein [Candidatus Omnitrophota bacterium]
MEIKICKVFRSVSITLCSFLLLPFVLAQAQTVQPTMIRNCQDLQNIGYNLSGNYALANDIDCTNAVNFFHGAGFQPIGALSENPFRGTLDGRNFSVLNLSIIDTNSFVENPNGDYVGIFRMMYTGSKVSNLTLKNVNIKVASGSFVGSLAGYAYQSTISNVHVEGGSIMADVATALGGLAGVNTGLIERSSVDANVSLNNAMTGPDDYDELAVGGLVGWLSNGGKIEQSFSKGVVKGVRLVGGLAGQVFTGNIKDSYSQADLQVIDSTFKANSFISVAGALGSICDAEVNNVYAAGMLPLPYILSPVKISKGGLALAYQSTWRTCGNTVSNSHWDINKLPLTSFGSPNSDGKITAEMKRQDNYPGWDFATIWSLSDVGATCNTSVNWSEVAALAPGAVNWDDIDVMTGGLNWEDPACVNDGINWDNIGVMSNLGINWTDVSQQLTGNSANIWTTVTAMSQANVNWGDIAVLSNSDVNWSYFPGNYDGVNWGVVGSDYPHLQWEQYPLPDLQIAQMYPSVLGKIDVIDSDWKFKEAETVSFKFLVANAGKANAGNSAVAFYIDGQKIPAMTRQVPFMVQGEFSFFTSAAAWTAVAGRHEVTAVVDNNSAVSEAQETNNKLTKIMMVEADRTPPVLSNGSVNMNNMIVMTDESAVCKFDTVSKGFISMASSLDGVGKFHSKTMTGLTPVSVKRFFVRCQDMLGNMNTMDYTIDFRGANADTTPPSVPQNLRVAAATRYAVSLVWDASVDTQNKVGYRVYRAIKKADGTYTDFQMAPMSTTLTRFNDSAALANYSAIAPGTTYKYAVRAYDASPQKNMSEASAQVEVTTLK